MTTDERAASRSSWWRAILIALLFVAAGIAAYGYFLRTEQGQDLDASTFGAVVPLREAVGPWAERLRLVLPGAAAALLLIVLVVALVRGRWRSTIAPVALVVLTLILSTLLKDVVVVRPLLGDHGYPQNTFPSGHAAVAVAALVGFLWLMPTRKAFAVLPLTVLAAATGLFQVASYAHRLSDVIAGCLLVGALAAMFARGRCALHPGWRWPLWAAVVIIGAAGVLCLLGWESSGYAWEQQLTATAGITLCVAAASGAALIVGAERPSAVPPRSVAADADGGLKH